MAFKVKNYSTTDTYEGALDQVLVSKEQQNPYPRRANSIVEEDWMGMRTGFTGGKRITQSGSGPNGATLTLTEPMALAQGKMAFVNYTYGLSLIDLPDHNTRSVYNWRPYFQNPSGSSINLLDGCVAICNNTLAAAGDITSNTVNQPIFDLQGYLRKRMPNPHGFASFGKGMDIGGGIIVYSQEQGANATNHYNGANTPISANKGGTIYAYKVGQYGRQNLEDYPYWKRTFFDGSFRWNLGDYYASVGGRSSEMGAHYGGKGIDIGHGRVVVISNGDTAGRVSEDIQGNQLSTTTYHIDWQMRIYTIDGTLVKHIVIPRNESGAASGFPVFNDFNFKVVVGNGVIGISQPYATARETDGKTAGTGDLSGFIYIFDLNGKYLGVTGHNFESANASGLTSSNTVDYVGVNFDMSYGYLMTSGTWDTGGLTAVNTPITIPFLTDTISDLEETPVMTAYSDDDYTRNYGVNWGAPCIWPGINYHESYYDGVASNLNPNSHLGLDFYDRAYNDASNFIHPYNKYWNNLGQNSFGSASLFHFYGGTYGAKDIKIGDGKIGRLSNTTFIYQHLDETPAIYYEKKVKYRKYRLERHNN